MKLREQKSMEPVIINSKSQLLPLHALSMTYPDIFRWYRFPKPGLGRKLSEKNFFIILEKNFGISYWLTGTKTSLDAWVTLDILFS